MSTWTNLGLPLPEMSGFGMSHDPGLLRTSVPAAHPRQTRLYTTNRGSFSLTFLLTTAQLRVAQVFLKGSGAMWFTMDLGPTIGEKNVRVIGKDGNPSVSSVGFGLHKLQLLLEERV